MGIFTKGINPGAYRGELTCPACDGKAIRFVENVTPFRLRYRCRKCGTTFQYDISNRRDIHPYAPFAGKGKFRDLIERSKGATK